MTEDVTRRTATRSVFTLDAPDAQGRLQRRYRCHLAPQHYRADGAWHPIDTTLLTKAGGWFHQGSGYQCELPATADGVFTYVHRGGQEFITRVSGALPAQPVPTNDSWGAIGQSLTYPNALGVGVSLIMEANRKGLKKMIRWDQAPLLAGDQVIVFELLADPGVIEVLEPTGARTLDASRTAGQAERVANATVRMTASASSYIHQPIAWDSNRNNTRRLPVTTYFYRSGGRRFFAKVIPAAMFARGAVYPVFADDPVNYAPPTAGNGSVESSAYAAWDSNHDATSGSFFLSNIEVGSLESATGSGSYKMIRGFCPFDTSGITDTDTVTAAVMNLAVNNKNNDQDNDGDDWFNIVESRQASMTTLANGDFDLCGSAIDNPVELSTRQDFSAIPTAGNYAQYTLNATGLALVSKTGYTPLAVREGHDCIDSPVVGAGAFTGVRVTFESDNHATLDPFLDVTASAGGPTAVNGAESLPVQISDVAAVMARSDSADTQSVSLSDQASTTALVAAGDTVATPLGEATALVVHVAPSDSLVAALAESSAVFATLAPAESLAAAVSEAADILARVDAPDSLVSALAEVATLAAEIAAQDSLGVGSSESTPAQQAGVPAGDTIAAVLGQEATGLLVVVAVAESLGVTLAEAAALLVSVAAGDSVAVVLGSEAVSVTIDEAGTLSIAVADTLAVSVSEGAALNATLAVAETLAAAVSDAAALLAYMASAESLAAPLSDAGSVAVLAAASDALAIGTGDSAAVLVRVDVADTEALGLSEANALLVSLGVTDALVAVTAESAPALFAQLSASESVSVQLTDRGLALVDLAAVAEALGVSLAEAAEAVEIVVVEVLAVDTVQVVLGESAAVAATVFQEPDPDAQAGGRGWDRKGYRVSPRKFVIRKRWP